MKRVAAISTGPTTHLDHLAPLCALLNVPLIVPEFEHLEIGKAFYPMVEFEHVPLVQLSLDYLATHFDAVIECGKFWAMALKPTIERSYRSGFCGFDKTSGANYPFPPHFFFPFPST